MAQKTKEKYITLKEAAEISGYAPDYVGQLIRKGKLPGKQMYSGIAWMTTEEALGRYMQRECGRKENETLKDKIDEKFRQIKTGLLFEIQLAKLFRTVLYFTIVLSVGFSLLLFYILSVSIEQKLETRALERIERANR